MPEPTQSKRFRVHLSTAVVLMFVAGILLWANMRGWTTEENLPIDEAGDSYKYICVNHGWPFCVFTQASLAPPNQKEWIPPAWRQRELVLYSMAAIDLIVALILIVGIWFTCEWLTGSGRNSSQSRIVSKLI